ncbi:hypothetical protein [Methanosarcina sp. KYL-1]|nr:hypothetical protein [Methanosarcina sp. KYL-1]
MPDDVFRKGMNNGGIQNNRAAKNQKKIKKAKNRFYDNRATY